MTADSNIIMRDHFDSILLESSCIDADLPMIIEHLSTDEEHIRGVNNIKELLK